jgi:hypothetical protein
MAETDATPAPATEESFSKDYVEQLKKQLEEKTRTEAMLKAKFSAHEERQRAQLAEMQPAVMEFIKEGMDLAGDFKHEMAPMEQFAASLAKAENVESAMPLARMITVHSAKFKREREEFSKTKDAATALAEASKELDEVKADRDSKAARIVELEGLAAERQTAAEKLTEELAKTGAMKEKYDFSKASSRESASMDGASSAAATAGSSAPFVDPLLSFVQKAGVGGGRIGQSSTGHGFLGNSGPSSDGGIAAAIRGM